MDMTPHQVRVCKNCKNRFVIACACYDKKHWELNLECYGCTHCFNKSSTDTVMCYRCNNFSKKIIKLKPKGVDDTVANIKIEYSATDLKNLVLKDLQEKFPNQKIELHRVNIETKSKQNYKSEWETADFRASINVNI